MGLASIQRNGGFRTDNLRPYGGECPDKLLVHPGDLYVSLKDVTQSADLLGAVAKLPSDHSPGRLTQDTVKLVPKHDDVPLDYIHWLLRTAEYRYYCRACATGTTNLGLPRDDFLAYPVPTLTRTRRLIVELLDALDDKVELNRRANHTLEAMAQAIFKDWFVDFGPVRAKAEGREPYLPAEIWDLFPNALGNDGKPVGWSVCQASKLFEFNPQESIKKATKAPYLNMAALPTTGPIADTPIEREYKSGSKFRDGDTLLARITPCLENGKTAFVFDLGTDVIGWGSTEFIVIRSRPPLPRTASYLLARDPSVRAHAEHNMTGTSGRQRANAQTLGQYQLSVPNDDLLWPAWPALGKLIDPMMDKIIANAHESRALAQTRDLLLPKLISGEIRAPQAEKLVEAVT